MPTSWSSIQAMYGPKADQHWQRCRDELGLDCPVEVFEELFFEHHRDEEFAELYRAVDWGAVVWNLVELSGVVLRRVGVDRGYQYAVDEARSRTRESGLADKRDEVVQYWASHGSWFRPPILVTGEVTGSGLEYELLVGFTRLGNLLGLLDRGEVPEVQGHRVWRGIPAAQ